MSVLPVDVPRIAAVSGGQRPDDVGEGPVWDDREHCVWWVDILGESIHRTDPVTGQEEMIAVGRMVGALGLREGGGLVAAVRDRSVAVNAASGHIEGVATGGKPDQPHAGWLFACRPSVRGGPGHRFAG